MAGPREETERAGLQGRTSPWGKGGGSRCALGEWAKIRFVLDLLPCFRLLASCLLTRVEEVPREHSFLP